jgi:diacylglycerol kinase family enzyme
VERRSTLKRYASHPLFIWSGLTTWFGHYDRSSPHLALRYPDGLTVDDGYMAIVQNTDPYTYLAGRPLSLAPEATLDRGLAVICVRTMAPVPMVRLVTGLLTSPAAVRKHPKVHHRVDVAALDVVGLGPVPYQVDGDYLGEVDELRFSYEEDALTLVVPVGP